MNHTHNETHGAGSGDNDMVKKITPDRMPVHHCHKKI